MDATETITYKVVLHQIVNNLSHSTGHHVGGVGEENGALGLLAELGVAPLVGLVLERSIITQSPVQLWLTRNQLVLPFC